MILWQWNSEIRMSLSPLFLHHFMIFDYPWNPLFLLFQMVQLIFKIIEKWRNSKSHLLLFIFFTFLLISSSFSISIFAPYFLYFRFGPRFPFLSYLPPPLTLISNHNFSSIIHFSFSFSFLSNQLELSFSFFHFFWIWIIIINK